MLIPVFMYYLQQYEQGGKNISLIHNTGEWHTFYNMVTHNSYSF